LLQGEPLLAYATGIYHDIPSVPKTIVVAPTTDQFEILRYERTDGANYDIWTEDIIEKLKTLDEEFGIEITGATIAGVEFLLKRIPTGEEARKLGVRLLEFCPDLYEAPTSFADGKVSLWWD
jgi:hypothetical protein